MLTQLELGFHHSDLAQGGFGDTELDASKNSPDARSRGFEVAVVLHDHQLPIVEDAELACNNCSFRLALPDILGDWIEALLIDAISFPCLLQLTTASS